MTKQEAIAAHRKMWRWIADETERRKYAVKKSEHCFGGGRGLYKKWVDASDNDNWAEAAALALVIAELPEREDIKDETD